MAKIAKEWRLNIWSIFRFMFGLYLGTLVETQIFCLCWMNIQYLLLRVQPWIALKYCLYLFILFIYCLYLYIIIYIYYLYIVYIYIVYIFIVYTFFPQRFPA